MSRWLVVVHLLLVWIVVGAVPAATLPAPQDGRPISCPYCDLRGANFAGRDLRKANFVGADLTKANLKGANLGGAALVGANLTDADLRDAILTAGTDLGAADLTDARIGGATLGGANFEYANLTRADLGGLNPSAAVFAPKQATASTARYYCGDKDTSTLLHVRYVAPSGTDSATCGTAMASACATIQRGIANCTDPDCSVLVAYGEYRPKTTVFLSGAISVYGGCVMSEQPTPK